MGKKSGETVVDIIYLFVEYYCTQQGEDEGKKNLLGQKHLI